MRSADGPAPHDDALPVSFDSLQQAAEWFAQLGAEDSTEQDRAGWRQWLEQRLEHRDAWHYIERVSHRFQPLQAEGGRRAAADTLSVVRRRFSRRQSLKFIAIAAGGAALGAPLWRRSWLPHAAQAWSADYSTRTGEIRAFALADGTRVWLNTASALDTDYRPALRRLHLVAGEVLIETAHDTRRPFVVDTAQGRLRALGTRFTVRQSADSTFLAVFEGAVEVRAGRATRVVHAGHQLTITGAGAGIGRPAAAERSRQLWSQGILLADNLPLRALLAELGRYRHGYLQVAPDVADLRVMGTFPLSDPDHVLDMLQAALPVQVRRPLPWWVAVERRRESIKKS
jgi:transmembrane sensor